MNTPALITRTDNQALPQWSPASPGYLSLESGNNDARQASRFSAAMRKYWWVAVLIWAVIAVPATLYIWKAVPPKYVATGSINVAPVVINPVNGVQSNNDNPFYNEFLRTQVELIKNPFVLEHAARDTRLQQYAWFTQLADQVGYLADHLNVEAVGSTQNINVTMTHRDPAAAKDIVDAVIAAYFRARGDLDDQNTDKSLRILKGLQADTEKALTEAQEKLARLQSDGDAMWSDEDRKVISQVLGDAKLTLGKLESNKINLDAQLEAIKSRNTPDERLYKSSVMTDTDPQIALWMQERIRVSVADSVLASKRATEKHPDRVEFRKQLAALDTKIAGRRAEIQNTAWSTYKANFEIERERKIKDTQSDLASVTSQVDSLKKSIGEQEANARNLGAKTQPILALKEQVTDFKDAYKRYTDRINDIENQTRAPGRVTAVGQTIQPKTPKVDPRPKYALAANGIGLFLGFGVLVILMKLRDKIDHADDLPDSFQPLIVGTVSHAGAASRGLPGRMRRKILGEEMRLLHANLLPPGRPNRRIMMVTSPTPANGKTSIASHLALSLAKSGLEVLLIDADLRKRDLSTMFDVGFRAGLSDLLQGNPPELIRPVELLPNLRLMGAGSKLERNPVELLQRKHFHESLNLLQEKFDCIIVDTPPALVVADARLIARSCDEVLCVIRANVSSPKEVNQTIDTFSRITGHAPKIIVNGVEQRGAYYKYKFAYTNSEDSDTADANDEAATPTGIL